MENPVLYIWNGGYIEVHKKTSYSSTMFITELKRPEFISLKNLGTCLSQNGNCSSSLQCVIVLLLHSQHPTIFLQSFINKNSKKILRRPCFVPYVVQEILLIPYLTWYLRNRSSPDFSDITLSDYYWYFEHSLLTNICQCFFFPDRLYIKFQGKWNRLRNHLYVNVRLLRWHTGKCHPFKHCMI